VTVALAFALLLALGSAVALNWAFYRQHGQVSALPPLALSRPLRSLRLLFADRRWLVAFGVGILGWILYVAALATGPLALVQAASAGGIGILALLVWRRGAVRLSRREWLGVGVSVGGLALLGASLAGGGQRQQATAAGSWGPIALWLAVSAALALLCAGPGRRLVTAGAGYGIGAGLLYAAGDVATKAAVAGGWRLLFVPAVLAAHGLAFAILQLGFQRGGALSTAGVSTLFTNAVPIAAGMTLFHEPLPAGAPGMLRVVAFAAVVAAAALLTRKEPGAAPAPPARLQERANRVAVDPEADHAARAVDLLDRVRGHHAPAS